MLSASGNFKNLPILQLACEKGIDVKSRFHDELWMDTANGNETFVNGGLKIWLLSI